MCVCECVRERQRDESLEEDLDIGGDRCQPVFHRPDIPHTPVTLYMPAIHVHSHCIRHIYGSNYHSVPAGLIRYTCSLL